MFGSLKNKLEMLQSSKRDIIIFEITYKLAATAVIYRNAADAAFRNEAFKCQVFNK